MITLLKLGGSLITDKNTAHTARKDIISRLADEIFSVWQKEPFPLIIVHGSGSFGHIPAKRFGTRSGVHNDEEWAGFAEVHAEATSLNRIVTDILRKTGLPVISFVPMDNVRSSDGKVLSWDTEPLKLCMQKHLIPLIFGDTVFDSIRGGTIFSTEDLFLYLCSVFSEPSRILLAGLEQGVWEDFPQNSHLIREIHAFDTDDDEHIQGSAFTDVTGGMREKVRLMKELVRENKADSAVIFSGIQPGNLKQVLNNQPAGTLIIR